MNFLEQFVITVAYVAVSTVSFTHSPFISSTSNASSLKATKSDLFTVNIALTRESGKNLKLSEALEGHPTRKMLENTLKVNLVELPIIDHSEGPDLKAFERLVKDDKDLSNFDYVVITSPESAKTFAEIVQPSDSLPKIAAVGKATKKTLSNLGFEVNFVPSKANGEALANELPPVDELRLNSILYPASYKAADTIQDILSKRKDASFRVERLNTYDTVPVQYTEDQLTTAMDDIHITCFGSPTAVDAWIDNVDRALGTTDLTEDEKRKTPGSNGNVVAVCIGSTTARRCLESGRWQANDIYYPSRDPGLNGWVESCYSATGDVMERDFWGGGW